MYFTCFCVKRPIMTANNSFNTKHCRPRVKVSILIRKNIQRTLFFSYLKLQYQARIHSYKTFKRTTIYLLFIVKLYRYI